MSLKYLHVLEFSNTTVTLNVTAVPCIDPLLEGKLNVRQYFISSSKWSKRLQNQQQFVRIAYFYIFTECYKWHQISLV